MRSKKKNKIITIRISNLLKNKLKIECDKLNVTMSEYILTYLENKFNND